MDCSNEKRIYNQDQAPVQQYYPQQPGIQNQPLVYNNQYGQPIQPQGVYMQPAIIVNQASPIVTNNSNAGLSPYTTVCPFCRSQITTSVETSWNCCACLLCCYTGFLIYACIQLCNNKSLLCCDATHRCPNCGSIISHYYAN